MKTLTNICRILVGIVFTFSGFVKTIDPLGTTYKFTDYFNDAFHTPELASTSFVLAIIMCAAELTLGLMLIFNILPKLAAWGSLLLMLMFTPLTLYLAIENPVTDCGCFGDALVLSNWQTFWKNVIILIPLLFFFFMRKKYEPKTKKVLQWIIGILFIVLSVGFEFYNLNNLPVIDFRPYKVGTYIPDQMIIPEGEPLDVYETILTYKDTKTGEQQDFTLDTYPWEDSTWVWVATDSKLVSKGYTPPIHDFTIVTEDGFDITEDILNEEIPVFLFVAYNLEKSKIQGFYDVKEIWDYAQNKELYFYCLTSSLSGDMLKMNSQIGYELEYCNTDEIQLKTIVRANPGLVLLKKGTVIGMWHWKHLPTIEEIENLIN